MNLRIYILFFVFFSCAYQKIKPQPNDIRPGRSFEDNPDESSLGQIHVIYALPIDGVDNQHDLNGNIEISIRSALKWFKLRARGRTFRTDTYKGKIDITFIRLKKSDQKYKSKGAYIRDTLEEEINDLGFNRNNKIYAIFYDGHTSDACASAPRPPQLKGNVFGIYLKGGGTGYYCSEVGWPKNIDQAGYREHGFLHEVIHTLGYVPECSPHFFRSHVSDAPTDLMYAGQQPWKPNVIDVGNDDYFYHDNKDCFDLKDSPLLE